MSRKIGQYPQKYDSFLVLRDLYGNYSHARNSNGDVVDFRHNQEVVDVLKDISGDLRRLEQDSQDGGWYTQRIAEYSGVDVETVKKVLKEFFGAIPQRDAWDRQTGPSPNPYYPGNYGGGINSSLD